MSRTAKLLLGLAGAVPIAAGAAMTPVPGGQTSPTADPWAGAEEQIHLDKDSPALQALEGLTQPAAVSDASGKDGGSSTAPYGDLRLSSMREEAMKQGMQTALSIRYKQIVTALNQHASLIDQTFNFQPLMIRGLVLPPVIAVEAQGFRKESDDTARSTRVMYKIDYPARIVTVAPNWRDFLVRDFPPPDPPFPAILPKTSDEQDVWRKAVEQGWIKGVHAADATYQSQLNLLSHTYRGMLTYQELLKEHIVSEPILARTDLGIVFEGKTLSVGDTLYRLTMQPGFQSADRWTPKTQDTRQTD